MTRDRVYDGPERRRPVPTPPAAQLRPPIERMRKARADLLTVSVGLEVLLTSLKAQPAGLSPAQVTELTTALDRACDGLSEVGVTLR